MSSLRRITTEYSEQEDRIKLAGLTNNSQTVNLWFTMRLMSRLIIHCLSLLERNTPELEKTPTTSQQSRKTIQNFVQKSAEQQITEEKAVKVSADAPTHLVIEIDVKQTENGVSLIFKGESQSVYDIFFNREQLRQWLGMLHAIWGKTGWQTQIWPDWMANDHNQPNSEEKSVH